MTATLGPLVVDAADPAAVGAFWSAVLGSNEQRRLLRFVPQRGPKTVKNRVHLDVAVGPDDQAIDRLLALGARVLAEHLPDWVTLADVEGNEFCAFPGKPAGGRAPARVFAVCTDSDRPEELASWWAARVGARIGPGPDQTPRWLYDCAGWGDIVWKFVRVEDPRAGPNRWRWSLTAPADDLLAAGATRLSDGALVDPQGNEFSAAAPMRPGG
ncbi:VOC family protein [Mycolicibacterium baixiangningiae]|uniref:VOC family protein n=1 Tax=Mycolicibacterium baixiangningiae TaxID=2761578 RepID=UPI001867A43A|nr:VOC family protein [Mycolicibacterium baixiangningiae]